MDIVIIADFYGNIVEKTDNSRFAYLAKMLVKDGHAVEIITSDFYHATKSYFPQPLSPLPKNAKDEFNISNNITNTISITATANITSSTDITNITNITNIDNITNITLLHEPAYRKNMSLRRFFSHYVFGKNVGKYLKTRKKPDVIYCAVPTLMAAYEAAKYCEKNHIRFIIDVQVVG